MLEVKMKRDVLIALIAIAIFLIIVGSLWYSDRNLSYGKSLTEQVEVDSQYQRKIFKMAVEELKLKNRTLTLSQEDILFLKLYKMTNWDMIDLEEAVSQLTH
jgi:FtsZ-interacting cell division protein ZipA